MARTKRKNLAAISTSPQEKEQEMQAEAPEEDQNVEVRKQRVLIIIPALPSAKKQKLSIPLLPSPPPPQQAPMAGSTSIKKFKSNPLNPLNPVNPLNPLTPLKLIVPQEPVDSSKVGFFRRKLERIGGLGLWLRSQGLDQFVRIFAEQKIAEAELLNLTMQALKDIGVAPVGPRRKLLWAIDQLCNG